MATDLKGSAEQLARIKGASASIAEARKNDINDLAREFAMMKGYSVPEGYDFEKAIHPDERSAWVMAKKSWEFWASRIPSKYEMDGKGLGRDTPRRENL